MRDDYLEMIKISYAMPPSLDFLADLQRHHIESLGWDTLDLLLGRPIRLDPEAIVEKFRRERRSGICYELNGAFCSLLQRLGFDACLASAHVLGHNESVLHFPIETHAIIVVQMTGTAYLVDVGWGDFHRAPVPLCDGTRFADRTGHYRLRHQPAKARWMMEKFSAHAWLPQYEFSLSQRLLADFQENLAALYSHPQLTNYRRMQCVRPIASGCLTVKEGTFTIDKDGSTTVAVIRDAVAISNVLRNELKMSDAFVNLCLDRGCLAFL